LQAQLEVAHFGDRPLQNAVTSWRLVADNDVLCASGEFEPKNIPLGNGVALGALEVDLKRVKAPAHCKLAVRLGQQTHGRPSGKTFENDWDIWVYPSAQSRPAPAENEILLASRFDGA